MSTTLLLRVKSSSYNAFFVAYSLNKLSFTLSFPHVYFMTFIGNKRLTHKGYIPLMVITTRWYLFLSMAQALVTATAYQTLSTTTLPIPGHAIFTIYTLASCIFLYFWHILSFGHSAYGLQLAYVHAIRRECTIQVL